MPDQNKHLFRSEKPYHIEPKSAEGSIITDVNGKTYIDFMSGWCVGNLGWNSPHLRDVYREFKGPEYIYPNFIYPPWDELSALLTSITPDNLSQCFRATGGSEAVELALQIAMAYTGRKKFLSLEDSYHGNTLGALSVGASENRDNLPNLLGNCRKIKFPPDKKSTGRIEMLLKKKDVAAFIMEPVLCNLGVHVPDPGFIKTLRDLCTRYGTCLIIDEVATGFGRTGKMFASEHFDLEPDILCLGKAITNGHAGMGATLTSEKIARKAANKLSAYSTFGWHPFSTHAALTHLKYFIKNKTRLLDGANAASGFFRTRLSQMKFKSGGRLNIIGMAISIDLEKKSYAEKVTLRCRENGLLISNQDEKIVMFPALSIEEKIATEGLNIFERCC